MRRFLSVTLLISIAAIPAFAGAKGVRGSADLPTRYLPNALDGEVIQVANGVDGRSWSAWAYRNGAEYDLALSFSAVPGVWSEPRLLGFDDGLNQGQPALTVDARGVVYLAYSSGDGALVVRALQPHSVVWSDGVRIEPVTRAWSMPSLLVVGDSLVVGFHDGERVILTALPLLAPVAHTPSSIYDGPDPIGSEDKDEGEDENQLGSSETEAPREGVEILPVGNAAGNQT